MKLKRRIKYYLLRLFRLKASPHQVASGLALGLVPCWFPTFGIGPFLSMGLAKLTRVNVVAAIVGGVIGTPIWPILFLLNYKIGGFFLEKRSKIDEIEDVEYINAFNHTVNSIDNIHSGGYIFIVGALINVLFFSFVIYGTVYFLFRKYRMSILLKLMGQRDRHGVPEKYGK
jgi:uncharacterized protein